MKYERKNRRSFVSLRVFSDPVFLLGTERSRITRTSTNHTFVYLRVFRDPAFLLG